MLIDHGMGVVIGETAEVGDDCTIYHGVTLAELLLPREQNGIRRSVKTSLSRRRKILGGFEIGDNCRIGSNAW